MNYGKEGDDPIKEMRFYSKSDQKTGKPLPEDRVRTKAMTTTV